MDLIVNKEISNITGVSVPEDALTVEDTDIDSSLVARENFDQICRESQAGESNKLSQGCHIFLCFH